MQKYGHFVETLEAQLNRIEGKGGGSVSLWGLSLGYSDQAFPHLCNFYFIQAYLALIARIYSLSSLLDA